DRLSEKLYRSRRDAVAARRDADRLQAHLNDSQASRAVLAAGVAALTEELGSARRRAQAAVITSGRPFVDPWVGLVLALALLGLAVTLAIRRRGGRIAIPDTPEELVRRDEMERRSLNR
nr:hypothetical protein [Actinomycetota bacterium]